MPADGRATRRRAPAVIDRQNDMSFLDHYRALRQAAVVGAVDARSPVGAAGNDRGSYLQGLLTNDVQALAPGTGCYAAWLTPQGRMLTDLHVFESGDTMLLDVPAHLAESTLQRLDQFLFSEDVQLADLAGTLRSVWIHGPAAAPMLQAVLSGAPLAGRGGLGSWPEYANARVEFDASPAVVARVSQLGVPGFCVYLDSGREEDLRRALQRAGAPLADPEALRAARIEAGYPVFGVDMTDDTIPLEAGIEDRAISFTKGCYVGQEVIIRVLHRGHGRVVRKLVAFRIDGSAPAGGARILAGEREVGTVTSAARSPGGGAIGLGYVHRDFVTPGTAVEVEDAGLRMPAVVAQLPMGGL